MAGRSLGIVSGHVGRGYHNMDLSNEIGIKICKDLGINPDRIISIDINVDACMPIPTVIIKCLPMSNDWLTDFSSLKGANITIIEDASLLQARIGEEKDSMIGAEKHAVEQLASASDEVDKQIYGTLVDNYRYALRVLDSLLL
jgi:hypothetical protein